MIKFVAFIKEILINNFFINKYLKLYAETHYFRFNYLI